MKGKPILGSNRSSASSSDHTSGASSSTSDDGLSTTTRQEHVHNAAMVRNSSVKGIARQPLILNRRNASDGFAPARIMGLPSRNYNSGNSNSNPGTNNPSQSGTVTSSSSSNGNNLSRSTHGGVNYRRELSVQSASSASPLTAVEEDAEAASVALPPASPGTPPKKIWERQYRNFLSRNHNSNSKQQLQGLPNAHHILVTSVGRRSSNSNVKSADPPALPMQVPHRGRKISGSPPAGVDGAGPFPLDKACTSGVTSAATTVASSSSPTSSKNSTTSGEGSVRGGKLFAQIFRGSSSGAPGTSTPPSHRRQTKSFSNASDELDGTLRRGVEKSAHSRSPGSNAYQHRNFPHTSDARHHLSWQCSDALPTLPMAAPSSASSTHVKSLSMGNAQFVTSPHQSGDNLECLLRPGQTRNDYSTIHAALMHIPGPHATFLIPPAAATKSKIGAKSTGNLMMATQALEMMNSNVAEVEEPDDWPESNDVALTPRKEGNDEDVVASASTATPEGSASAMKKAFTKLHNAAQTGSDAVSAYLGDDPSVRHTNTPHSLSWTRQNNITMGMSSAAAAASSAAASSRLTAAVSFGNFRQNDPATLGAVSGLVYSTNSCRTYFVPGSSAPDMMPSTTQCLETLHENVVITKALRILKPVLGVDYWHNDRRYLIAPAALAACPMSVLKTLSSPPDKIMNAQQAGAALSDEEQVEISAFGTIRLGECLLCNRGDVVGHLTVQQWSSATLVLRQNYLLEYNQDDVDFRGCLPRGYAHLQYSTCYPHPDFTDALELHFFGSPCAKSDKRVLMIRLMKHSERDAWMKCLNRAALLDVSDLYDYNRENPLGEGEYACVYAARRRGANTFPVDHDNPVPMGHGAAIANEIRQQESLSSRPCDCAIKIFDKTSFWKLVVKGRERADTLVREASVQATLTARCGKVPSFLRIRGFFETSNHIVLELELLDGIDLFEYISARGTLKEPEAARIIQDILRSLDAMNRIGLAHRDIKPANILVCQKQIMGCSVKVCDFGMSTFVGVDGLLRGRCGTPGYVAPEIFSAGIHGGYGNKVDIFSAGVTLYVMLCGYEPFYGETDAELVEANKIAKVDFADEDWSSVSASARDLVQKMMAPNPSDRLDARGALQHPWFDKQLKEEEKDRLDKSLTLPNGAAPAEDACVIS